MLWQSPLKIGFRPRSQKWPKVLTIRFLFVLSKNTHSVLQSVLFSSQHEDSKTLIVADVVFAKVLLPFFAVKISHCDMSYKNFFYRLT